MTATQSTTVQPISEATAESDLPKGWVTTPLGKIAEPSKEKIEPDQWPDAPYLSLGHVESHTNKIIGQGVATDVRSTKTVFHAGDVLYGKLRPYLNKVCAPDFAGICSTDFLVFPQQPWMDNRLLMWFLSQPRVVEHANHHSTGIELPRVNFKSLSELDVPIQPLAEQKRIVAKVEELLVEVNKARKRLAKVPVILKRFRQSVLAAACSGRLTEDWRRNNPTAWVENSVGDGDPPVNIELPETWNWFLSSHEFSTVTSGSRGWAKYYADDGPIFIRVGNLSHDSIELDLRSVQHVRPPSTAEGMRTRIKLGDILISITADVGMIALIDDDVGEAYINQHVALARPGGQFDRRYLAYFLSSTNGGQQQFQNLQRGATKVGLGLDDIRSIWIARPPIEEQKEIVRRVEALFNLADMIENRLKNATARTEKLTQSILAKASRGELVPTEAELARRDGRNFEPASVLLEKIQAERATQTKTTKRSKPKTRKENGEK